MKRETRTKAARSKLLDHERVKAPSRPRATPLEPLSNVERSEIVKFERGVAELHLKEAISIQIWGGAPNACIHSAYYGMYHTATAVLHINGGVGPAKHVPKAHEGVLQHFTTLATKIGGDAVEAAKLLNRARSMRMAADYGGIEPPDKQDVEQSIQDALRFTRLCSQLFSLPALDLPESLQPTG